MRSIPLPQLLALGHAFATAIVASMMAAGSMLTRQTLSLQDNNARAVNLAVPQYPHARFLRMAREITLTHHEQFEVTSYPSRRRSGVTHVDLVPVGVFVESKAEFVRIDDAFDATVERVA